MVRKHVVALCILALCLATVSCKKLGTGPLKYETAKFTDTVPQDYGPLIGVIQTQAPDVVALWFQRSDGTIDFGIRAEAFEHTERVGSFARFGGSAGGIVQIAESDGAGGAGLDAGGDVVCAIDFLTAGGRGFLFGGMVAAVTEIALLDHAAHPGRDTGIERLLHPRQHGVGRRLLEFAVVLLVFVIAMQLREMKEELKSRKP